MADSFSVQTDAPLLQSAPAAQLGRMGSTGGGQVRGVQLLQPINRPDPTAEVVMKLGQAVLEPMIKKRQAEQFLEGAQRVAQGEALKDIVDEQPWYTKIFGESVSVQGARTVAQIAQVDKYTADLYGDMARLQTLGREEVGKEVNGKMLQFLTGDAAADAVIQQKMVESAGPFYNAHAKANYKWTQDTMQKQVTGMMVSAAESFQAASRQRVEGTMSDDDWNRQKMNAASVMAPIQGQSPESYWAAIQGSAVDAMANGNHHFAALVFDSGVLDSAPVETRKALLDAREKYEARTVEREGFLHYGATIGELQGKAKAGILSPAQLAQSVNQINEDFRMRTGIEGDILSRKTFSSMLAGNFSAMYRRAETNAKENAKEAAKQQVDMAKLTEIHQAALVGAGNLITAAGHKKTDVDTIIWGMAEQAQASGQDFSPLLIRNYNEGDGYVNPMIANKMQASLRAAKGEGYSGKAFDQTYSTFRQIADREGGQAAAMAYLGEEDGVKMLEYDSLIKADIAPEFAYQMSFGKKLDTSRSSSDKDVMKKLQSVVESQQPGWWAEKLGKAPANPAAQRIIANTLGQSYDLLASGGALGDEAAFKIGMDVARQKLDIVGPFAYAKRAGQQPMSALLGTDDDAAGQFFEDTLRADVAKQGLKMELASSVGSNARMIADGGIAGLSPFTALGNAWDHFTRKQPDVPIQRGVDRVDPKTGLTYSTFSVQVIDDEGNMAQLSYDSRDLRKKFEESSYFK